MSEHLIDMRLTKKEREEESVSEPEEPKYPYGLTLHLDSKSMNKIGMKKLPTVGSKLPMTAMVSVTSVSIEDDGDGQEQSMTLQIESIALAPEERPTTAQVLFDDNT